MSKPAPYTRDTIARIRVLAEGNTSAQIACELGWDRSLVESVARRHQIDLATTPATSVTAEPVKPAARRAAPPPAREVRDDSLVIGDMRWSQMAAEVERRGVLVYLPKYQNSVFAVLLRNMRERPDEFIDGQTIALRAGLLSPVGSMLLHVRRRLAALNVAIETGPNRRGFRLVIKPWPVKPAHPMPAERMA